MKVSSELKTNLMKVHSILKSPVLSDKYHKQVRENKSKR